MHAGTPLQFAFNTLARVDAVSHGVCNVVNRVVVIVASGNPGRVTWRVLLGLRCYDERSRASMRSVLVLDDRLQAF